MKRSPLLLVLAYLAFVSLGLPDAILGVAWPSLRSELSVPQGVLGAPLAIGAAAYFVSGLFAGRLLKKLGVGMLLSVSTALVAGGISGYAAAPAFGVLLGVTPLIGFGSGAIDAALNTYAAKNFGARHMSWLHAAYAVGATAGPAIMTAAITRGRGWRFGYGTVAALLISMGVAFVFTRARWGAASEADANPDGTDGSVWQALRSGRVVLQCCVFFLYTGVEVCAGQWAFTLLTESRGYSEAGAGTWVSLYWGGLLLGRVVLGFAVERFGTERVLRWATVGVAASAALFFWPGHPLALPLLSFSLASIYPGLMSETPRRVGEALAPHSVGFQVSAATVGVAVLPSLGGALSARYGLPSIAGLIAVAAVLLLLLHEVLVGRTRASPR